MNNSEVGQLIVRINKRHKTQFKLIGRYNDGENQGAYALSDPDDDSFVLKWKIQPAWLERISHARQITDYLRSLGALVPGYLLADVFPEGETYWIQTALPGLPISNLTKDQLYTLLGLNDLQAGRAISTEQNWSIYLTSVVFEGGSGWAASLRNHSIKTRELLLNLEKLIAGYDKVCNRTGDIVHGDLSLSNILAYNGRISGIVDWDAAGCGDRAFDLALLLFYSYENVQVRSILLKHILELTGLERLKVYLVYAILAQLDWSIRHHSPVAVSEWIRLASQIHADLTKLTH